MAGAGRSPRRRLAARARHAGLTILARLVPAERRRDWVREWRGELAGSPARRHRGWLLVAVRDALELRRLRGRDRRPRLHSGGSRGADPPDLRRVSGMSARRTSPRPTRRGPPPGPRRRGRRAAGLGAGLALDLRRTLRSLRRSPGFSLAVIVVLAVGIGGTTTIWAVVDGLMLRPLPYEAPGELAMVWERAPGQQTDLATSPQGYRDMVEHLDVFEELAAFSSYSPALSGRDWPVRVRAVQVMGDYFGVLGAAAGWGRALRPDDADAAAPPVVLSWPFWQGQLGGDPSILDREVVLNGRSHPVVGVMGPEFWHFDPYEVEPPDLWMPASASDWSIFDRGDRLLRVVGRLRDGVGVAEARAAAAALGEAIARDHPDTHEGWALDVLPLHEEVVDDVRGDLLLLLAAVGLVLLIACADVVNLLLARSAARRRELAVREALGAGWLCRLRLQTVEALMLALAGGALGVLIAAVATRALVAISPAGLPLAGRIGVDAGVILFVAVLSTLLGAALGALSTGRPDGGPGPAGAGSRGVIGGRRRRRIRDGLVVGEVALSLVLLGGAGLLVNSYARLLAVDPGFDDGGVLTFQALLRADRFEADAAAGRPEAFFVDLAETLAREPGVVTVGATSHLPFSGWNMSVDVIGGTGLAGGAGAGAGAVAPRVGFRRVIPGYFEAMGLAVVAGRDLELHDGAGAAPVALVNRALAGRLFPGADPVGRRLLLQRGSLEPVERTIVGVVQNVKHHRLGEPHRAVVYVPLAQDPAPGMRMVVRSSVPAAELIPRIRALAGELDGRQPLEEFATLESLVAASLTADRFHTTVLGLFGAVALLLVAAGISGVVAHGVQQRRGEVGVRLALGARPASVVALVVRQAMRPVGIGLVLGGAGALATGRLLSGLLYGVGPGDPATLAAVVVLLGGVALLSSWLPARRVAGVDPVATLRSH